MRYAINAPAGSASPDKNDIHNAFLLLPEAQYIGIATEIPSGILCIATAIAIAMPKDGL